MLLISGLAKLFPITPTGKETGKSQKEADERYGEYEGTGIQWIVNWVRVLVKCAGCITPTCVVTLMYVG